MEQAFVSSFMDSQLRLTLFSSNATDLREAITDNVSIALVVA
jgi:hypothetical protein